MTPSEYAAAVTEERRALTALQRRLRAFGNTGSHSDGLAAVVTAYAKWHRLALSLVVAEKRGDDVAG